MQSLCGGGGGGGEGSSPLRTEWVRLGLRGIVMKVLKQSHTSAEYSIKSALTSVQSTLRGVGQKERPLASNWVSS